MTLLISVSCRCSNFRKFIIIIKKSWLIISMSSQWNMNDNDDIDIMLMKYIRTLIDVNAKFQDFARMGENVHVMIARFSSWFSVRPQLSTSKHQSYNIKRFKDVVLVNDAALNSISPSRKRECQPPESCLSKFVLDALCQWWHETKVMASKK